MGTITYRAVALSTSTTCQIAIAVGDVIAILGASACCRQGLVDLNAAAHVGADGAKQYVSVGIIAAAAASLLIAKATLRRVKGWAERRQQQWQMPTRGNAGCSGKAIVPH